MKLETIIERAGLVGAGACALAGGVIVGYGFGSEAVKDIQFMLKEFHDSNLVVRSFMAYAPVVLMSGLGGAIGAVGGALAGGLTGLTASTALAVPYLIYSSIRKHSNNQPR